MSTPVLHVLAGVAYGGHFVPEQKIRERYRRLWRLVAVARDTVAATRFYDNSSARRPFTLVAAYEWGELVGRAGWPAWTPAPLVAG